MICKSFAYLTKQFPLLLGHGIVIRGYATIFILLWIMVFDEASVS